MEEAERNQYEQFRSWHDEAYLYINQAITQEKPNIDRKDVALMMYQKGLGLLDLALCVDTESYTGQTWDKARTMQQKMSNTRVHVESRIKIITDILAPASNSSRSASATTSTPSVPAASEVIDLTASPTPTPPPRPSSRPPARPPTYEEAISPPPSYTLTNGAGAMSRSETSDSVSSSAQGEILFSMSEVQVFHVSADGEVTTPSYPETLHVVRLDRSVDKSGADLPPAFLEVGQWTYPLVRGRSPVMRSSYGGYMFPDLEKSDVTGGAVGLLIPESVTDADREIFESLLAELTTVFRTQEQVEKEYAEYREFSSSLASGLVSGAELVGRGMVKGAVKTSEYLFHGSEYAKQHIVPDSASKGVDPKVQAGLETAKWVSTGACRVSGWLVSKVGSATAALGRVLAPHLEQGATRALTHFSSQSSVESSQQIAIAGEIASGTVAAVSTMFVALENSSKILAKNLANNTVMIVSHKYGPDMAAATDAAFATAGNSYQTFYNVGALGVKGIAKRAVKDTAKAAIGVDQAEVNRRADRSQDAATNVNDVVRSFTNTENQKKEGS